MKIRPFFTLRAMALLAVAILSPQVSLAQTALGSLTGAIRDASGAAVAGAKVTLLNEGTGILTSVLSSESGSYLAPQLRASYYRLEVQAAGFKKASLARVKIDVGEIHTQDITLEIGDLLEVVKITAQQTLTDTVSGSVGTTLQVNQVLELPFSDRNVFNLINLVPGAFFAGAVDDPAQQHMANVSLGGSRFQNTSSLLDGISNTRGGLGISNVEIAPPVDSIQEFRVQVNSMSAEYGHSSGGVVSAVTRSGSSEFHGSLYEYLRNDKFDAVGWGADRKPPLRRNNFGLTIGGPVIRNRTFFFYNFDGLHNTQSSTLTRDVGRPEWRQGNFSTATRDAGGSPVLVPIHDPETGTGSFGAPRGTLAFPGNIIPASRLDPIAVKAVAYLPSANRTPNNPSNYSGNWQTNQRRVFRRDFHVGRIDHELSSMTKMFGRFVITHPEEQDNEYSPDWGPADQNGGLMHNRRQNLGISVTHIFTPQVFSNFSVGYNRVNVLNRGGNCCETNYADLFGIKNAPGGTTFPAFQIAGGLVPISQIGNGGPNRLATFNNLDITGDVTLVRGSHTIKAGVMTTRSFGPDLLQSRPTGAYGFDGHFTRGVTETGAAVANSGINLADFLLGRLNSVDVNTGPTFNKRVQYYAGYVQDAWKATQSLTLNWGVRYETQTPDYETSGRRSNYDLYARHPLAGTRDIPATAVGVVSFQGRNGYGKYLYRWPKTLLAPRFGFAYRVTASGNTSIRGGYGIFYGTPTTDGTMVEGKLGFGQDYSARNPIAYRLRDGIPAGATDTIPESELTASFGARGTRYELASINSFDPQQPAPYTQNLNLNIQHQWMGMLIEAGYLGNLGRQVTAAPYNINLIHPTLLTATNIPEHARRPFSAMGSNQGVVSLRTPSGGISNYHAFTLKIERRMQSGFAWTVAYTLSKWIDNVRFTSNTGNTPFGDNDTPQNIYDRRNERSLSTGHVPQRVVFSPIIELPFGKGKRYLSSGAFANALFGGWQLSTLASLQKGSPYGVTVLNGGRDILGDTSATLRPNLIADPASPAKGTPSGSIRGLYWLEPSAFSNPSRNTYGNSARTLAVLGPGIINFDAMLAKSFRIKERIRAQLRWELFDATNTPRFLLPEQNLGAGNFGIITTATGRRIMQFGLKLNW